jgi:hypothetical protein
VCPGLAHRTVRCATGQCPLHQGTSRRTLHLRENLEALRYNSRTVRCTPDSVRCPKEERLWNSPASGIHSVIVHRTCPVYTGLSGEPAEQRLLRANGHLQAHLMRARSEQKSGTRELAHRTLYSTCPVCHRTSRRA